MGELLGKAAGLLLDAIVEAKKNGASKEEAERAAAAAVTRGEVVSDDLYDALGDYVQTTRDFERDGAG